MCTASEINSEEGTPAEFLFFSVFAAFRIYFIYTYIYTFIYIYIYLCIFFRIRQGQGEWDLGPGSWSRRHTPKTQIHGRKIKTRRIKFIQHLLASWKVNKNIKINRKEAIRLHYLFSLVS